MPAQPATFPDWRDAAAYAPLLDADRALFAWEWLRRDPRYREAAQAIGPARAVAEDFGLIAFEAPGRGVPEARPIWTGNADASVLMVETGGPAGDGDMVDFARFGMLARVLASGRREHLLLSDGLRQIRLDGPAGAFTAGPVALRYRIEGVAAAAAPLLTLRRFVALAATGRFARQLHERETRSARWILFLRAWDALSAGASQRTIAQELLNAGAAAPRWRVAEPSLRLRAQRLVRSARGLADGGYRSFLCGSGSPRTVDR